MDYTLTNSRKDKQTQSRTEPNSEAHPDTLSTDEDLSRTCFQESLRLALNDPLCCPYVPAFLDQVLTGVPAECIQGSLEALKHVGRESEWRQKPLPGGCGVGGFTRGAQFQPCTGSWIAPCPGPYGRIQAV